MNDYEKVHKDLRMAKCWMLIVAAVGALIMTFPAVNPIGLMLMTGVTIAISRSLGAKYPDLRTWEIAFLILSVGFGGFFALLVAASSNSAYSPMEAYGLLAVSVSVAFEICWGATGIFALISEYADSKNPFEKDKKD